MVRYKIAAFDKRSRFWVSNLTFFVEQNLVVLLVVNKKSTFPTKDTEKIKPLFLKTYFSLTYFQLFISWIYNFYQLFNHTFYLKTDRRVEVTIEDPKYLSGTTIPLIMTTIPHIKPRDTLIMESKEGKFKLNDVLLVLHLKKNLLSVGKFNEIILVLLSLHLLILLSRTETRR